MRAISTLRIRHMLRQACSLALAGIVLLAGCQRNEDRTLADELDRIIEQRQTFNDKKEERISELKRMLDVTGLSPRQEYDINARLCDQYWKYNLDSAIRYAERNLQLARQIRDDEAARTTSLRLTQLYSFSGKSIEAKRILDTTRRNCRSTTKPSRATSSTTPSSATKTNTDFCATATTTRCCGSSPRGPTATRPAAAANSSLKAGPKRPKRCCSACSKR